MLDTGMILVSLGMIFMATDVLGVTSVHDGFHWNVASAIFGVLVLIAAKATSKARKQLSDHE